MSARSLRLAAALLAVLAASSCEVPPPQQKLPEITFSHLEPYRLDVGRVEIVSEYQAPMRDPNVEHVMPLSPEAAVKRWAQDRLQPMGRSGIARLIIRDAGVVERKLPVDKGLAGLFKEQQAERYEANLVVVMQVLDERQLPEAEVTARVSRARTAPEGMTLNQRDRLWFEMTEDLVKDMNAQLDGLIRQYFARWIL